MNNHLYELNRDLASGLREAEAEVERLKKLSNDWMKQSDSWLFEARAYKAEVKRLKKELEKYRLEFGKYFDDGVFEGERRAMERVKGVLNNRFELWKPSGASENRSDCIVRRDEIEKIYNDLGLGEEKKR